jgi:hypothetical protein
VTCYARISRCVRNSPKAWPLLALLAEVLAFFRHILFYGHYAIPWDFRYYHLSLAWFVARSFARGELPLWDPYTYCGMPFTPTSRCSFSIHRLSRPFC